MNQYKAQVRRGGIGKGLFATLFFVGAAAAYVEHSREQHVIVEDPYNRTKKSVSEGLEHKHAQGAVDEIQKAGQHVKQSAKLAGQAIQDTWDSDVKHNIQRDVVDPVNEKASKAKQSTHETVDYLSRKTADQLNHSKQDVKDQWGQIKHEAKETYDQLSQKGAEIKEETKHAIHQTVKDAKIERFREQHHLKQGTRSPEDVLAHTGPISGLEMTTKHDFDRASTAHGNPMVYEKQSPGRTKPGWEQRMENYATGTVRDTSTLVGKDTEKVRSVWEDKADRDRGHTPHHKDNSNSFWSHLFGQASEKVHNVEDKVEHEWEDLKSHWNHHTENDIANKAQDVKHDVSQKAQDVKHDLSHKAQDLSNKAKRNLPQESLYDKAQDAKHDLANKAEDAKHDLSHKAQDLKHEVSHKVQDVKHEISNKAHDLYERATDTSADVGHKIDGSLNELHKEVSAQTGKWKKDAEKNAKSWYEKSTDQVKSQFESIKTAADKDLDWAGRKVQHGVERIFNTREGDDLEGHIRRGERIAEEELGHLRGTQTKLTPAEIIVENAHGKDM